MRTVRRKSVFMSQNQCNPRNRWIGWWRAFRRHKWEALCLAGSEQECFHELLKLKRDGDFLTRESHRPNPNAEKTLR